MSKKTVALFLLVVLLVPMSTTHALTSAEQKKLEAEIAEIMQRAVSQEDKNIQESILSEARDKVDILESDSDRNPYRDYDSFNPDDFVFATNLHPSETIYPGDKKVIATLRIHVDQPKNAKVSQITLGIGIPPNHEPWKVFDSVRVLLNDIKTDKNKEVGMLELNDKSNWIYSSKDKRIWYAITIPIANVDVSHKESKFFDFEFSVNKKAENEKFLKSSGNLYAIHLPERAGVWVNNEDDVSSYLLLDQTFKENEVIKMNFVVSFEIGKKKSNSVSKKESLKKESIVSVNAEFNKSKGTTKVTTNMFLIGTDDSSDHTSYSVVGDSLDYTTITKALAKKLDLSKKTVDALYKKEIQEAISKEIADFNVVFIDYGFPAVKTDKEFKKTVKEFYNPKSPVVRAYNEVNRNLGNVRPYSMSFYEEHKTYEGFCKTEPVQVIAKEIQKLNGVFECTSNKDTYRATVKRADNRYRCSGPTELKVSSTKTMPVKNSMKCPVDA